MELNIARIRQLLKAYDFRLLFIEELGWDHHDARLDVFFDGRVICLQAFAQKRGMVAYLCPTPPGERLPDHAVRRKIEHQAAKAAHEHLIVFIDADQNTQVWQWVRREPGKPIACREHTFHKIQPGDALIQKLQAIAFSLEEEETLTLFDVTRRASAGFDVERVTKRFYDRFKKEHSAFLKFVSGISEKTDHEWYASVMLNRLMFVYFIQRKGFLDGDTDYLRNRLARMRREYGRDRFYSFYRYFLLRMFHEGLGGKMRTAELEKLLGKIPYFDGGFFEMHPVEQRYPDIQIPDKAFERIFDYFDQYQWYLDERPLRADNEINPDVLGYIFEKYINQKQMGAYYTKEDITEYISKNTVIPFLFDAAKSKCKVAFENPGGPTVWNLLSTNPDRYLYGAVKHGVIRDDSSVRPEADLPDFVRIGMHDPKARMLDNRYNLQQAPADDPIRLVTETWREYVCRRNRCLEIREKLQCGEIKEINDLITLNLDIRQFAQDVIENCDGPDLLRAFWHTINGHIPEKSHEKFQNGISILDPTCGSGAFLFAALNILEPLYEACLDRMAAFVEDLERSNEKYRPEKFSDFRNILKQVEDHPNRRYFVFKNIILNNLFGVDIMEEAVEICKLRLFLKLVAQVEPDPNKDNFGIEPLPDIDFNIRSGNTIVGYAAADEVRRVFKEGSQGQAKLQFREVLGEFKKFEEQVELTDRAFKQFRCMQIDSGMNAKDFAKAKQTLRERLKNLNNELNLHLADEYEVKAGKKMDYGKWLKSHQPFHWFVEFYDIIQNGGFDVIIGNPPYVELSSVAEKYTLLDYKISKTGNLYSVCLERFILLLRTGSRFGVIVPISSISTPRMLPLMKLLISCPVVYFSNFAVRPGKLFVGVDMNLTICVGSVTKKQKLAPEIYSTSYNRWTDQSRDDLFSTLTFQRTMLDEEAAAVLKIGSKIEKELLPKVMSHRRISKIAIMNRGSSIYYHSGGRYFRKCLRKKLSNEYKELKVNKVDENAIICLLSSTLYYWIWIINSDCYHVTKRDISIVPIPNSISQDRSFEEYAKLLLMDLENNAQVRRRQRADGTESKEVNYYVGKSKTILDKIDTTLAEHFHLKPEELDFILNFDCKYRFTEED